MSNTGDRKAKAKELIEKAKAQLTANKGAEAEGLLRQAIALDRQSVNAHVELARILSASQRDEEANKMVDEALNLSPQDAEVLALKGLMLAQEENYRDAIDYYRRAIKQKFGLVMAYVNLGAALREIDELTESEQVLRQALALDSNNYLAHYQLAQTLAYQLKVEDAIYQVIDTLKINPYFVRGYLALARLYQQGKELDLAIKILKECLKNNPRAWEASELLKDFYMLKGDFDNARLTWDAVVKERGGPEDLLQHGNIALAAGQFEEAEKAYKRAIELDEKFWRAHYALAEIYDVADLKELAGQEYELAVQYNDGSFEPHNGYGLYLIKKGDLVEAIKHLSKACNLSSEGEPTPVYNLALALVQAEEFEKAHSLLNIALEDAPDGGLYDEMRRMKSAIERELSVQ